MARADWRRIVLTMRGCAWPSALTAMPPRKSRYFLPVESKTNAPRPWVMTTGGRLYVGKRNCSASSRRVSGLMDFTAPGLGLGTERDRAFFLDEVRIMP